MSTPVPNTPAPPNTGSGSTKASPVAISPTNNNNNNNNNNSIAAAGGTPSPAQNAAAVTSTNSPKEGAKSPVPPTAPSPKDGAKFSAPPASSAPRVMHTGILYVAAVFSVIACSVMFGPFFYFLFFHKGPDSCEKFRTPERPYACDTSKYSRGEPFKQLPYVKGWEWIAPFYTNFELNYNPDNVLDWMKTDDPLNIGLGVIPMVAVTCYLLFLFFGRQITNQNSESLISSLVPRYWNLFLCVFSFWGASRTVPHLIHNINTKSFEETVCDPAANAYGAGACGLAMQLFVLSKFPELVDTVLLTLKNSKPRPMFQWNKDFLHWYHHITVLSYCWNAYVTESAAGLYFGAMNFTVHSIMYGYYFCSTLDKESQLFKLSKKIDVFITIMQTSQMFVGVFIVGSCIFYNFYDGPEIYGVSSGRKKCNNKNANLTAGFIMYGSYLYLFMEFLIKKYVFGTAGKSAPVKPGLERSSSTDVLNTSLSSQNLREQQFKKDN